MKEVSRNQVVCTLDSLKDLGILEKKEKKYTVTSDFDLVVRGLIIKRLKRIVGVAKKSQLRQSEIEAIVDSLSAYGFFNVTQSPRMTQVAVDCLLTFRKEKV